MRRPRLLLLLLCNFAVALVTRRPSAARCLSSWIPSARRADPGAGGADRGRSPRPASPKRNSAEAAGPPRILTDIELTELLEKLVPGIGELPSSRQLRAFRAATSKRLLLARQLRKLASEADGGAHMFREAYATGLLADADRLTAAEELWLQTMCSAAAAPVPSSRQHSAELTITCYDGRSVQVSPGPFDTTVQQVLDLAGQLLGLAYDPSNHSVFAVGPEPGRAALDISRPVQITGLVLKEDLNGQIGQVVAQDGELFEVNLWSGGSARVREENLACPGAVAVQRNPGTQVDLDCPLSELHPSVRFLWLERAGVEAAAPPWTAPSGALRQVHLQLGSMDLDGDGRVSAAELRNYLWSLGLTEEQFRTVWELFSPNSSAGGPPSNHFVDPSDVFFLIGRAHLQFRDVPVDALIHEAVVSILGRRPTAHIDRDLSQVEAGIGYRRAWRQNWRNYTLSLLLPVISLGCSVALILRRHSAAHVFSSLGYNSESYLLGGSVAAYGGYLAHLLGCGLTTALHRRVEGMEKVLHLLAAPRGENPHYKWRSVSYHYETVVYTDTTTDSKGNTRFVTRTRRVRVETHRASKSGEIGSSDRTAQFIPDTTTRQTEIKTSLDLDFSQSNYLAEFRKFCVAHNRDVHQDTSHCEDMPSRLHGCLAVWVPRSTPWWMSSRCYWLANAFLLSAAYRWRLQAKVGQQEYTYHKVCHDIVE